MSDYFTCLYEVVKNLNVVCLPAIELLTFLTLPTPVALAASRHYSLAGFLFVAFGPLVA